MEPRSRSKRSATLREFRAAAAARPPDLALVDLNLPDGSAVEILHSPPESGPFPVLAMTSSGDEQVAVEAIKAGAMDYIVKIAGVLCRHAANRGARPP